MTLKLALLCQHSLDPLADSLTYCGKTAANMNVWRQSTTSIDCPIMLMNTGFNTTIYHCLNIWSPPTCDFCILCLSTMWFS